MRRETSLLLSPLQQLLTDELQELRESLRHNLNTRFRYLIIATQKGPTRESNHLAILAVDSEQCATTVRTKHDNMSILLTDYASRLSPAQPTNHTFSIINEEP